MDFWDFSHENSQILRNSKSNKVLITNIFGPKFWSNLVRSRFKSNTWILKFSLFAESVRSPDSDLVTSENCSRSLRDDRDHDRHEQLIVINRPEVITNICLAQVFYPYHSHSKIGFDTKIHIIFTVISQQVRASRLLEAVLNQLFCIGLDRLFTWYSTFSSEKKFQNKNIKMNMLKLISERLN